MLLHIYVHWSIYTSEKCILCADDIIHQKVIPTHFLFFRWWCYPWTWTNICVTMLFIWVWVTVYVNLVSTWLDRGRNAFRCTTARYYCVLVECRPSYDSRRLLTHINSGSFLLWFIDGKLKTSNPNFDCNYCLLWAPTLLCGSCVI